MILLMVSFGFIAGAAAGFTALLGGASLPAALLAYAAFSGSAAIMVALLTAAVPVWHPAPPPDDRFRRGHLPAAPRR
ncbi:MAG TPA: hypothetical protein ENK80_01600 [Rhodobacterales bacterium]|nr:hypothetical protein [Rhodobacterales bacterium]